MTQTSRPPYMPHTKVWVPTQVPPVGDSIDLQTAKDCLRREEEFLLDLIEEADNWWVHEKTSLNALNQSLDWYSRYWVITFILSLKIWLQDE